MSGQQELCEHRAYDFLELPQRREVLVWKHHIPLLLVVTS